VGFGLNAWPSCGRRPSQSVRFLFHLIAIFFIPPLTFLCLVNPGVIGLKDGPAGAFVPAGNKSSIFLDNSIRISKRIAFCKRRELLKNYLLISISVKTSFPFRPCKCASLSCILLNRCFLGLFLKLIRRILVVISHILLFVSLIIVF
jgi:hypothetical protein